VSAVSREVSGSIGTLEEAPNDKDELWFTRISYSPAVAGIWPTVPAVPPPSCCVRLG
jgi:hypothetical protein